MSIVIQLRGNKKHILDNYSGSHALFLSWQLVFTLQAFPSRSNLITILFYSNNIFKVHIKVFIWNSITKPCGFQISLPLYTFKALILCQNLTGKKMTIYNLTPVNLWNCCTYITKKYQAPWIQYKIRLQCQPFRKVSLHCDLLFQCFALILFYFTLFIHELIINLECF